MLEYNPKARIIWAHAGSDPVGWYKPKLVKKMLAKYPNLYFSIRASGPPQRSPAWTPRDGINYSWTSVYKKYPDRFVMGSDSFTVASSYSGAAQAPLIFQQRSQNSRNAIEHVLEALNKDVRKKIAYENAVRLYHLN